jgi:hypothetical protein
MFTLAIRQAHEVNGDPLQCFFLAKASAPSTKTSPIHNHHPQLRAQINDFQPLSVQLF